MSSPVTIPSRVSPGRLEGGRRFASGGRPAAEPLISVISVVRNARQAIEKTAESVLSQQDVSLEYLVIDGASTDGTRETIQNLETRIDYWVSEEDAGIYDAMNKGIRAARGRWIHFLNAGDLYGNSGFWAGLAPILSHYDKPILLCPVATQDHVGTERTLRGRKILYGGMPYCHQGILFRRELFDSIGLFDLKYRICSDYDWLVRFFQTPAAGRLDEYAISGKHAVIFDRSGLSTQSYSKREQEVRQIVRNHYGVSWQWLRCILVSHLRVAAKSVLGSR